MLIKYDSNLINVPDQNFWRVSVDIDSVELVLTVYDEEIVLRDFDRWQNGNNKLPFYAVYNLYMDMFDVIAKKLVTEPEPKYIDIDEIEEELIRDTYFEIWLKNKFIELDEDGNWQM